MFGDTRYNFENFVDAINNPEQFIGEVNRIGVGINKRIHALSRRNSGTRVADEDWDNFVILDGCRYDMFEEQCPIDGELQQRRSLGSESWEFLRENFLGETHHDTVYVTANPHAPKLPEGTFYTTINLLEEGWSEEDQTVLPGTVVKEVLNAYDQYPNKRFIIHFMQPHYPFIGEHGKELTHRGLLHPDKSDSDTERQLWGSLGHGRLDIDNVWKAYRENLDIVFDHVTRLMEDLPGKYIITSDHGNLLGDRTRPLPFKGYGHPRGLDVPELRNVPWLIVESEKRRSVRAAQPIATDRPGSSVIDDRLSSLGYK